MNLFRLLALAHTQPIRSAAQSLPYNTLTHAHDSFVAKILYTMENAEQRRQRMPNQIPSDENNNDRKKRDLTKKKKEYG